MRHRIFRIHNLVFPRASITLLWITSCCTAVLVTAVLGDVVERTSQHGPVQVRARLEPAQSSIGDPVTLTLRATAEKDVELLMPDFGEALDRFSILDFTQREEVDAEGRTVMEQIYQLDPPRSGKQSIPPIMVEFVDRRPDMDPAPEGLDAYELLTERLGFEVASALPDNAAADLHAPFSTLPHLAPTAAARWTWIAAAFGVAIVVMVLSWPLWIRARRRTRRRSAYDLALGRLGRLATLPRTEADQIDAFFVELSAIVRWYVENRFDLKAPELTTEEFLAAMSRSPDLTSDHQTLLRDFLRRADLVKFANFIPAEKDITASVSTARRFLEDTRQHAPMLEPEDHPGQAFEVPPPDTADREVIRV